MKIEGIQALSTTSPPPASFRVKERISQVTLQDPTVAQGEHYSDLINYLGRPVCSVYNYVAGMAEGLKISVDEK